MAPPARAEAIPPAIAPNIITSLKWLETNNLFNNLIQRNQSAAFSSGKVRPNHETNINIIARRTGKDVNSHTVLDGIITTIMATIQRINIIGSREGSRNRRRLKANQTGIKLNGGLQNLHAGHCPQRKNRLAHRRHQARPPQHRQPPRTPPLTSGLKLFSCFSAYRTNPYFG